MQKCDFLLMGWWLSHAICLKIQRKWRLYVPIVKHIVVDT